MKIKIIFLVALLMTTHLFANGDVANYIDFVNNNFEKFLLLYFWIFCAITVLCCFFAEKMKQIIWMRYIFAGLFVIFTGIGIGTNSLDVIISILAPILGAGFIITFLFTKRVRKKELIKEGVNVLPSTVFKNGDMLLKDINGEMVLVNKTFRKKNI